MVVLAVSDFAASLAWYRDVLGLRVVLTDEPKQFALLQGESGGRIGLKIGTPAPGGVTSHLEVTGLGAELVRLARLGVLAESPLRESPEGYREVFIRDPDGYAVGLFEWVQASRAT